MATDSSAGININLSSGDAPAPVQKPAAKKPASGNGAQINTAASSAAKPTTAKPAVKKTDANAAQAPNGAAAAKQRVAKPGDGKAGADKAGTGKAAPADKKAAPAGKTAKTAAAPKEAASTREEMEELSKMGALSFMTLVPAWMISAIIHMVILLIFGLMLMPEKHKETLKALVANVGEESEGVEDVADLSEPTEELDSSDLEEMTTVDTTAITDTLTPTEIDDTPAPTEVAMTEVGIATAPASDLLKDLSASSAGAGKGSLAGRASNEQSKKAAGATDASEAAVARALKWLAEHQYPDGSWNFDHTGAGKCQGQCGNAGKLDKARFAATGFALLPFLGAGQTHKKGKFKDAVRGGLYYLSSNMKVDNIKKTGNMTAGGGSMYGHGIATIALCEGYAMTQDKSLVAPAQLALNFIADAQDPVGGGWRYQPRQPGDTSAVGWQIMALKSGKLGYLQIPKPVVTGAMKFLDSAQADGGAFYGYTGPGKGQSTTAVGLLCRMYLGWEHDKPALAKGVQYLAKVGPQTGNMYFSYYATQVLHQFDGPDGDIWQNWNVKMRDSLVASQEKVKHETGSWQFKGNDHGFEAGGRLYCTAMAAMTLEIYYRYMPIYTQKAGEDDWKD